MPGGPRREDSSLRNEQGAVGAEGQDSGVGLLCFSPLYWQSVGGLQSHPALPQAGRPTWGSGPGRSASARVCSISVQPPSFRHSGC